MHTHDVASRQMCDGSMPFIQLQLVASLMQCACSEYRLVRATFTLMTRVRFRHGSYDLCFFSCDRIDNIG